MSGYFDKLIESYGPAADAQPAQMPWMAEVAVDRDPADESPAPTPATPAVPPERAAVPVLDPAPPQPPPMAAEAPAAVSVITPPAPAPADAVAINAPGPDLTAQGAVPGETAPAISQTPADPAPIIHQQDLSETHLHVTQTHLHQHDQLTQVIAPVAFTPDAKPDADSTEEITPAPAPDDLPGALAALEAHLARTLAGLHGPALPPPSVISPADFEPEGSRIPPPAEPETIREVTREIVREIHHHHETHPPAPPRPAPQTAAEASRIGPIRFASVWDRGGRAS